MIVYVCSVNQQSIGIQTIRRLHWNVICQSASLELGPHNSSRCVSAGSHCCGEWLAPPAVQSCLDGLDTIRHTCCYCINSAKDYNEIHWITDITVEISEMNTVIGNDMKWQQQGSILQRYPKNFKAIAPLCTSEQQGPSPWWGQAPGDLARAIQEKYPSFNLSQLMAYGLRAFWVFNVFIWF